jgi:hypothetical protein
LFPWGNWSLILKVPTVVCDFLSFKDIRRRKIVWNVSLSKGVVGIIIFDLK